MEAFCSPSQLRDMDVYTRCVRAQWEVSYICFLGDGCLFVPLGNFFFIFFEICPSGLFLFEQVKCSNPCFFLNECVLQEVRAEISGFLQQLRFEVMRKHSDAAALQCELHSGSPAQVSNAGEQLGLAAPLFWCWALLTFLTSYPCFSSSACLAGDWRWDLVILILYYGCSFTECCFCFLI